MASRLEGVRVAVLATDGVEQVELQQPWDALEEAGAEVDLVAPKAGSVRAFHHVDKGDAFEVDRRLGEVSVDDYDALYLPGGVVNADALRTDRDAVELVRSFFVARKPVAAICHAPWLLAEAAVIAGRTLTSWPSLRTDLHNAGANWVDEESCLDGNLLTSRGPRDLPVFVDRMLDHFRIRAKVAAVRGGRVRPSGRPGKDIVDERSEESFPASDAPAI